MFANISEWHCDHGRVCTHIGTCSVCDKPITQRHYSSVALHALILRQNNEVPVYAYNRSCYITSRANELEHKLLQRRICVLWICISYIVNYLLFYNGVQSVNLVNRIYEPVWFDKLWIWGLQICMEVAVSIWYPTLWELCVSLLIVSMTPVCDWWCSRYIIYPFNHHRTIITWHFISAYQWRMVDHTSWQKSCYFICVKI